MRRKRAERGADTRGGSCGKIPEEAEGGAVIQAKAGRRTRRRDMELKEAPAQWTSSRNREEGLSHAETAGTRGGTGDENQSPGGGHGENTSLRRSFTEARLLRGPGHTNALAPVLSIPTMSGMSSTVKTRAASGPSSGKAMTDDFFTLFPSRAPAPPTATM